MQEWLFICSGNYYRSRFAQAVFNHHALQQGLPWQAFSRGLSIESADFGDELSPHTIRALADRGIPVELAGDRRVALTADDLARAARVTAVKHTEHYTMMREQFPDWADRIDYWEIHDLDFAQPQESLPLIEQRILNALADLAVDADAAANSAKAADPTDAAADTAETD